MELELGGAVSLRAHNAGLLGARVYRENTQNPPLVTLDILIIAVCETCFFLVLLIAVIRRWKYDSSVGIRLLHRHYTVHPHSSHLKCAATLKQEQATTRRN